MGVIALLIQEITGGKNLFILTRFPLTVSLALPIANQFYQQIKPTLPQLPSQQAPEIPEQTVASENTVSSTELVTNTFSVLLGDAVTEEEGENYEEDPEPNLTQGKYRAHYATLGDVSVVAIAPIQSNPFEASLCLRKMKRVLIAACKTGPDGEVSSKELQKSYGEVFFALERVLDGDEGVTTFSARLQEVQPHLADTSHESGRVAVLNTTTSWKEAKEEYEQQQKWLEETTTLTAKDIDLGKADDKDHLMFDSSWSAPLVKTRSNKWTEISYGKGKGNRTGLIGQPQESKSERGKEKAKDKEKDKEEKGKVKVKKSKKEKEKEKEKEKKKESKSKIRGKEKPGKDKEKKEKKAKKRENGSDDSEKEKATTATADPLARKKKALAGDAQRKLSIGMERRGTRGSGDI